MEHAQGSFHAAVVLEEFGDYQCPASGQAYPLIEELRQSFGSQLRFVYRHFPLRDIHPHAERAAEAAEAAGEQNRFWEMHRLLFAGKGNLNLPELIDYAGRLGLQVERFEEELTNRAHQRRVADNLREGMKRGVRGTPEFFINGVRYEGPVELEPLTQAIQKALDQELIRRAI